MARPYGIVPRNAVEEAAWPALRGQIFMEAAEIFLRLLRRRDQFRDDSADRIDSRKFFEATKIG